MTSPIQSIVVWAHRRRAAVFALAAFVVLTSALGLRRLQLDADVVNLLPAEGRAITPFRAYLQEFGTLDQLLVVFTAPDGQSIADVSPAIDRWIAALRAAPEIEWVDTGTGGMHALGSTTGPQRSVPPATGSVRESEGPPASTTRRPLAPLACRGCPGTPARLSAPRPLQRSIHPA